MNLEDEKIKSSLTSSYVVVIFHMTVAETCFNETSKLHCILDPSFVLSLQAECIDRNQDRCLKSGLK